MFAGRMPALPGRRPLPQRRGLEARAPRAGRPEVGPYHCACRGLEARAPRAGQRRGLEARAPRGEAAPTMFAGRMPALPGSFLPALTGRTACSESMPY